MITPADNMRRKPTGEVRPYDSPAKLLGAPGSDASFHPVPNRQFGLPGARKATESPGGASKGVGHMGNPG